MFWLFLPSQAVQRRLPALRPCAGERFAADKSGERLGRVAEAQGGHAWIIVGGPRRVLDLDEQGSCLVHDHPATPARLSPMTDPEDERAPGPFGLFSQRQLLRSQDRRRVNVVRLRERGGLQHGLPKMVPPLRVGAIEAVRPHHLNQATGGLGIDISAGERSRLLTENHDGFHREKAEVLQAGLQSSDYVDVDDTGARHQGKNGYCTALGNERFAYFERTDSKSRLNFLQVLRGPTNAYTINEVTVAYWQRQQLAQAVVEALQAGPCHFAAEAAWQARLQIPPPYPPNTAQTRRRVVVRAGRIAIQEVLSCYGRYA